MKPKPMVYIGPMVLAIMADLKTNGRQIMRPQPPPEVNAIERDNEGCFWSVTHFANTFSKPGKAFKPPHQPGDIAYVGEHLFNLDCFVAYKCDNLEFVDPETHKAKVWPWKKSLLSNIFMPRWAARTYLKILDVKAERIQDISEEDIKAEGVRGDIYGEEIGIAPKEDSRSARIYFMDSWDSIHGKDAWDRNDWVWAYEFERTEKPEE